MPRKTLVFGNGLGMALDHEAFSLPRALEQVWEDPDLLSDEQRDLIRACLPDDTELGRPSSEDDLDLLQRVLASCDFLNDFEIDGGAHWLSEHGRAFPPAIRRFIHQVACRFHRTGCELPDHFAEPLINFVHQTKSHVATLNYDPLLYEAFIREGVLTGYNGDLIDGLTGNGFAEQNLHRHNEDRLGWYLHLHGSPLFYDGRDGRVKKLRRPWLNNRVIESTHLVLTHVKHKTSIISASEILSSYWKFLRRALAESEELIFFGYSGYDSHLNLFISRFAPDRPVRIVEWSQSQPDNDRQGYWTGRLKRQVALTSLDNILTFQDWN